jgi:phenylalanyl-tRNA synthetase beta chain
MKFTYSWLRDHLDTDVDLDVLSTRLSAIGLEVESIENPAASLSPFIIARVVEARQHPNADRLRVCQVDTGSGIVEVVCGAPNARTGLIGVFGPLGSFVPGTGITLDKRPVRGVVSNGMLMSERELALSDEHEGIIELGEDKARFVGKRYIDVLGLDDPVIEVKLTPNRPDCTGVRGIARDAAAAGLGRLKPEPAVSSVEGDYDCPVDILLEFEPSAASACPVFAGRYIRGISNGAAPALIQARLKAVGLRPINAVVDVTNYISMDRGRPLHVYDADKLEGAIRARLGRNGERFKGLDGKEHAVDDTMCVIADARRVLGFGGILGGEESGSTNETRNILIESAYFDPVRTATTGRKAGVQSDARYRFERGVDPGFVVPGLDLATQMMMQVAGGSPSRARVAGKPPMRNLVLGFDFARVRKLGGIDIPQAEARRTLAALGFKVDGSGQQAQVAVPSWRPDVHGPADLVEEIVRIAGLDRVPAAAMPRPHGVARSVLTERQRRVRRARRTLAGRGLVEAVTWSFIDREHAIRFGGGAAELELANPISSEMTSMRPGLLPGLLAALERNRNRGFADIGLFEIGQCYRGDRPEDQFTVAAGVRVGLASLEGVGRHWQHNASGGVGWTDVKADAVGCLEALGVDASRAQLTRDCPPWYHPGRSGTLRLGPKTVLAHFGVLHPDAVSAFRLAANDTVCAFEIFIDALPPERRKASRARPPLQASDLLPVRRDFAFVIDRKVAAADVIRAATGADKALIANVGVFDVFEGASLGNDKRSLAIEVTLQPTKATLTDAEIDAVSAKVIAAVKKATGGEIRG